MMPEKRLVIIGDGPERSKVEKIASSAVNVQYLGYQEYEVLKDHMMRAKAFIFAAEEDFGIVPLEAQACGTPVIAFGKGGALDTVIDNKTGMYFHTQETAAIIEAVNKFEANRDQLFNASKIRAHAMSFSTDVFKRKFKQFVLEKCDEKGMLISLTEEP
jgi:glycosyltransferase involved in cell wall biosynthesis